jgi:hypothetical protein
MSPTPVHPANIIREFFDLDALVPKFEDLRKEE